MRYWFDTEFQEWSFKGHVRVDLISIGVISETGQERYWESQDYNTADATPWLRENVLPHLHRDGCYMPAAEIARELRTWINEECGIRTYQQKSLDPNEKLPDVVHVEDRPEFWAYFADYDWTVMCSLFGTMMDLPKGWPMFCLDLKQSVYLAGNPPLPPQTPEDGPSHNALADARWLKRVWNQMAEK